MRRIVRWGQDALMVPLPLFALALTLALLRIPFGGIEGGPTAS